jgi:L-ascorbate metabolism protein UlaG (beta-lactamase superfamily)
MKLLAMILLSGIISGLAGSEPQFTKDVFETSEGDLAITFVGHGTLMFEFRNMVIHVDPVMAEADYKEMPDGDLVLVTHQHGDHLDVTALKHICAGDCPVVMTQVCLDNLEEFKGAVVMKNGDTKTIKGIKIEAIPAYNIQHKRANGNPYHPKGEGNGYVVTFGDRRVLIGGDTENTPEIKQVRDIDIAFLPMNLPYTMTPEMVADAAKAIQPAVLYPYHYGQTDPQELVKLLKDEQNIEVRIRDLQ